MLLLLSEGAGVCNVDEARTRDPSAFEVPAIDKSSCLRNWTIPENPTFTCFQRFNSTLIGPIQISIFAYITFAKSGGLRATQFAGPCSTNLPGRVRVTTFLMTPRFSKDGSGKLLEDLFEDTVIIVLS